MIPLRRGQTTAQALLASRALARLADKLGYTRYWVAEHHNTAAIASTVPAVLVPYLAQGTTKIRFGSGGVMLGNHAPLAVAEQFALLSEMYPGRIDLGLGRAPGTDQLTAAFLRGGRSVDGEADYVESVELLQELLGGGVAPVGASVQVDIGGSSYELRATPAASSATELWLLGSSAFSAQVAAALGLPYVFANHFGIPGIREVLGMYRAGYVPSARFPEPRTFLPVNVVVGGSQDDAERLALPYRNRFAKLRTGGTLGPQEDVETLEASNWSAAELRLSRVGSPHLFVGTAEGVAAELRDLAAELEVEEMMVVPVAGSYADDPMETAVRREQTLTELAAQILS